MKIEPYLFFDGRCDEAIEFYQQALGAQLQFRMTYGEGPEPATGPLPAAMRDKVMHATLLIDGAVVMVSDGVCDGTTVFKGFSLSLDCPDEATARRVFDALAVGGSVSMPLAKTFWAPQFGMLNDRFGVGWMVGISAPSA